MGPRPPIHSNADPKEVAARWARQGSPIGKGGFGTVWRVVWESGSGPKEAALKLVDVPALCAGANSAQIKQDIQRELDLAARLSQIQGITSMLEAFVEPSGANLHPACIRSKYLLDARALHPALHPCSTHASAQASAQTLLCTRSAPTLHSSGCRRRAPGHGDLQRPHVAVGARQARRPERGGDEGHHAAAPRGRRAPARQLVEVLPHSLASAEAVAAPAHTRGHTQPTCGARIGSAFNRSIGTRA